MGLTRLSANEIMALTAVAVCLPLVLVINFSLFQYLLTMFYRRRREPLVGVLLAIAFLSFASLIPFGFPDVKLVRNLNDISEACSVLTFLLQISVLTRDINKKMKLKALRPLLFVAESLVLLGLAVLVCNFIDIVAPDINMDVVEHLDNAVECASLVFIFSFRFYFLSMAKGFATVWRTQKLEMLYYLLLVTHKFPFMLLNALTGLSWEHVQGVWMRITIVLCLWMTIKARLSSGNSRLGGRTTGMAVGPSSAYDGRNSAGSPVKRGPHQDGTVVKVHGPRSASVVPMSSSKID